LGVRPWERPQIRGDLWYVGCVLSFENIRNSCVPDSIYSDPEMSGHHVSKVHTV
jgi:hypothetical protein